MNKTIYFVVGPTGIGKSALALKLAKKLNGQIINADSMQVYKKLKVLTARPNLKDTTEVQHHLYGHINCTERYNVAKWCKEEGRLYPKLGKNGEIFIRKSPAATIKTIISMILIPLY